MNKDKLIKSLGTPEVKLHIAEILSPAILLSYTNEDKCWHVMDAREVEITEFEYDDLNKLIKEFNGEILAKDDQFCLLTRSEDTEKKEMLKKYWEQTTILESLSKDKNTLTKFTYQLLSLEKLIPSLLEPFPVEILLNILIDSLGEIFTASAAAYTLQDYGKLKIVGHVGSYNFPSEFQPLESCYPGSVIEIDSYHATCISEDQKKHYLLFYRETPFQEEELSILKMLTSLLQKSRLLLLEQSRQNEVETLVNQFEFSLHLVKNFSISILSSFDEKELYKNICDAVKEMFQAQSVSIYEGKRESDRFNCLHYANLKKQKMPDTITFDFEMTNDSTDVYPEGLPRKHYTLVTDSGRQIVIFIGESVLENYYQKEIITTFDKIIPAEIKKAFANVDAINKVKEQKEYCENVAGNIRLISDRLLEIEKAPTKQLLLEKVNELARQSVDVEFEDILLYQSPVVCEGKTKLNISDDEMLFGSVILNEKKSIEKQADYLLPLLSQAALQTAEKINVFRTGEVVTDFETIIVDYLKVKYRLAGFSGSPVIHQLDVDRYCPEKLDGCGVGLKYNDVLFFATWLSEEAFKGLFD